MMTLQWTCTLWNALTLVSALGHDFAPAKVVTQVTWGFPQVACQGARPRERGGHCCHRDRHCPILTIAPDRIAETGIHTELQLCLY